MAGWEVVSQVRGEAESASADSGLAFHHPAHRHTCATQTAGRQRRSVESCAQAETCGLQQTDGWQGWGNEDRKVFIMAQGRA